VKISHLGTFNISTYLAQRMRGKKDKKAIFATLTCSNKKKFANIFAIKYPVKEV
jgi:hypothetical protein